MTGILLTIGLFVVGFGALLGTFAVIGIPLTKET